MTLPYREWTSVIVRTITYNSADNKEDNIDDWTTEHIETGIIGHGNDGVSPKFWGWKVIYIASDGFQLESSADQIVDVGIDVQVELEENSAGVGQFVLASYLLYDPADPDTWDPDTVNGKYYDGVNQWGHYPPTSGSIQFDWQTITVASLPFTDTLWTPAYIAGPKSNQHQDDIFRVGFSIFTTNYDVSTPFPDNKYFKCTFEATKIKAHYLNPIVNSLSKRKFSGDGGEELVMEGLGFKQSNSELSDTSRNPSNNLVNWDSIVDEITFEGQEGQGSYTLYRGIDFTVDSDTKITIPSMPAMNGGVYRIKLFKENVLPGLGDINVESYAGEFFTDETGKMSSGVDDLYGMFTIVIGEAEEKAPYFTWEWAWKIAGELVWKYYAPIDMRAADRFYEGRILSAASATRSIDDFTGMFQVADMEVELASNDSEFQKLLAQGYCKNQPVKLYFGWTDEPAGWMQAYFQGIVDDYIVSGPTFKATLKDITQKYLRKKLPLYIVTTEEWPNAHRNAVGKSIPEVLGLHSLTAGEHLGAIEAHCVDTTAHKYIAAAHPLNSVLQVYADDVLVNPANYTVSNDAEGRTFITFTSSQGDKKITYNAEGYSLAAWNSVNNPAYVLGFFLIYLAEMPIDYIDTDSLDEVADLFEDNGWGECGKLALTELEDASSVLQKLLFSFGIKAWPDREGKLHFGRKDLTTFDTDKTIIAQTDCIDAPMIEFNMRDAVNRIKVCWDYYPAASVFGGAREFESESSITDFESEIENYETWEYPYVSCEDFAVLRAGEDLQRLAYGNRVVSFTLPIDFIDELEIFDTFILQDTFGLSPSGEGEEQHYYYVISLTYDFQNMTIGVKASDLQWLVGQCFIIGRCEDLEHNYEDASQWMRVFGYVGSCATGTLPGGDPLKKICKCQ